MWRAVASVARANSGVLCRGLAPRALPAPPLRAAQACLSGTSSGPSPDAVPEARPPKALKKGDWQCPKCSAHNFASKTACYDCAEPRPVDQPRFEQPQQPRKTGFGGGARRGALPGDWACPSCTRHNYARRTSCFSCDAPRPAHLPRHEQRVPREPPARVLKPGDWACPHCDKHNFASKQACIGCAAPRPADKPRYEPTTDAPPSPPAQ